MHPCNSRSVWCQLALSHLLSMSVGSKQSLLQFGSTGETLRNSTFCLFCSAEFATKTYTGFNSFLFCKVLIWKEVSLKFTVV